MKAKFYRCPICGNVIVKLIDGGQVPVCCNRTMQCLTPFTASCESADGSNYYKAENCPSEASPNRGTNEHHIPVVEEMGSGNYRVCVGKDSHPMSKEHHIAFIVALTKHGATVRMLSNEEPPCAQFHLDEPPLAFYAYCNVHGLWMKEL